MLRSRGFGRLLLATVVPLIVVESVLQLGALAVAAFVASRERAGAGAASVLCIGDSNTYGLGASRADCSYPAVLETLLRDAHDARDGGAARVVNAGWPGRNSRSALELLPRQLQEFRPRRVVILVGVNDFWSHPGRVKPEELAEPPARGGAEPRFRFEWRLPRLIALVARSPKVQELFASRSGAAPPAGAPPRPAASAPAPATAQFLVGRWRAGASRLELNADGSALFDGAPLRWNFAPRFLGFVGAGATTRVRWRLESGRLDLDVAGEGKPREFVREPDAPDATAPLDANAQAWRAIEADDLPKALQIVRAWLADQPESPQAHAMLANVGTRLAQEEIADEGLDWLRDRHLRQPDVLVAEALVTALWDVNRSEETGRVAQADLERWPDSVVLWSKLAQSAENARDVPTLERAVERALAVDPRKYPYPLAGNLRMRARLRLARSDLRGAARDALEAFAADGFEGELRTALRRYGMRCDPALVDELASEVGLAGERLAAAKRIAADAVVDDGDGPVVETLVDHLEQIVRYCRNHGAEPLLLNYPFHKDALARAQRRAAQETGTPLVDVTACFDRLLAEHAWEEFFVPDGHCNDRGYRSIAEEVARALRR